MLKTHYDIIIIGAGIVGLTFALCLAESDLRIAIVDSKNIAPFDPQQDYDLRVSAITPNSEKLFQQHQVWQAMLANRAGVFREMRVWHELGGSEMFFSHQEIASSHLGHILENHNIVAVLYNYLQRHGHMHFLLGNQPTQVDFANNHVRLTLHNGKTITSKLIVGADGAYSWLRKQSHIDLTTTDYQQHAIVANVITEKSHQQTAWQRFLTSGPLAHLPLPEANCTSIVWSCDLKLADELMLLNDDEFKQRLAQAFNHRLGEVKKISERRSFPLVMRHAKQYIKPNLALIGDAAHTLHPLAGQGVNLGINDAKMLATTILEAVEKQRDFAAIHNLRRYERACRPHNSMMIHVMTGFKHLFGNDHSAFAKLRDLGFKITNRSHILKKLIMHTQM